MHVQTYMSIYWLYAERWNSSNSYLSTNRIPNLFRYISSPLIQHYHVHEMEILKAVYGTTTSNYPINNKIQIIWGFSFDNVMNSLYVLTYSKVMAKCMKRIYLFIYKIYNVNEKYTFETTCSIPAATATIHSS